MEFFGPWHVREDSAAGSADLDLYFTPDGRPLEAMRPAAGQPAEPPTATPATREEAVPGGGDSAPFAGVLGPPRSIRLRGTPWSAAGHRPFACEFLPRQTEEEDRVGSARGHGPAGHVILVVAGDVLVDDSDLRSEVVAHGRRGSVPRNQGLEVHVVRVQDARDLPDLGEAISLRALLSESRWCVNDAILARIDALRDLGLNASREEEWLARAMHMGGDFGETLRAVIRVERAPDGLRFAAESGRWRVDLRWDLLQPSRVAWELLTPLETETALPQLRIVCTRGVVIRSFVSRRTARTLLDGIQVLVHVTRECAEVPAQGQPVGHERRFELWQPEVTYEDPYDQWKHEFDGGIARRLAESPTLPLLPLFFIGPEVAAVAAVLAIGLSIASIHYTQMQHYSVVRYGVDPFGQPMTDEEAEEALQFAILGLVMDAAGGAGAVVRLTGSVGRTAQVAAKQVAAAATPALRIALRGVRPMVLVGLLRFAARKDAAELFRAWAQLLRSGRLLRSREVVAAELRQLLTDDFLWFRIDDLKYRYSLYVRGVEARQARVLSAGRAAEAREITVREPLDWLTTSRGSTVRDIAKRHLGPDWVQKIRDFRRNVPLRDELLEIFDFLNRPLSYDLGRALRFSPGKRYGLLFEFDHPVENRLIEALSRRHGIPAQQLIDYETATVFAAPKNSAVAHRIRDFTGYVHSQKTRRMETLIAYGKADKYTLQEMYEATAFSIMSLGGRGHPALTTVQETFRDLAVKTGEALNISVPITADRFRIGSGWKYYPPSTESMVRINAYYHSLELIQEEVR